MASPKDIIIVDVTVTQKTLEDDLYVIYNKLFKEVKKEDLVFEELKGGYINSIQRVYLKDDQSKSLVFRTFGMKINTEEFNKNLTELHAQAEKMKDKSIDDTKATIVPTKEKPGLDINTLFFNRLTEFEVIDKVSKYDLCKPVYAKYNNGLCYGYTHGVTLNGPLMLTTDFLEEMSRKLAKFHTIHHEISNLKFATHFERMNSQAGPLFEHMAIVIDNSITNIDEYPYDRFPKLQSLSSDEKKIMSLLSEIGLGDITFCHNDTNQKNIIWNVHERVLGFIDFEMAMNNYATMEIGQLFFCYTGHFLVDFDPDFFPNAQYRRRFLRNYMEQKNKLNKVEMRKDEFDSELEKLFHQTNLTTIFFMLRIIIMTPFFDFDPELFKNQELDIARSKSKYYCGAFGYRIYELFEKIKGDFIQSAEDYLKQSRKTES